MSTFFSAEPAPSEARDVARILLDTLYDLRDIRSVIRDKNDEVAVILQRTESALRAKAQQLTGARPARALVSPCEPLAPQLPVAAEFSSLSSPLPCRFLPEQPCWRGRRPSGRTTSAPRPPPTPPPRSPSPPPPPSASPPPAPSTTRPSGPASSSTRSSQRHAAEAPSHPAAARRPSDA